MGKPRSLTACCSNPARWIAKVLAPSASWIPMIRSVSGALPFWPRTRPSIGTIIVSTLWIPPDTLTLVAKWSGCCRWWTLCCYWSMRLMDPCRKRGLSRQKRSSGVSNPLWWSIKLIGRGRGPIGWWTRFLISLTPWVRPRSSSIFR